MRSSKVIVGEIEAIIKIYCIKVFKLDQSGKGFYSEVEIIRNVRQVMDSRIIRKELPHHRGIIIGSVRCVIINIKPGA